MALGATVVKQTPIHAVVVNVDPRTCVTLPMFCVFTGSDTACLVIL